jgi:hypothetical protein
MATLRFGREADPGEGEGASQLPDPALLVIPAQKTSNKASNISSNTIRAALASHLNYLQIS